MAKRNKDTYQEKQKYLEVHRAIQEFIISETENVFKQSLIHALPENIYRVIEILRPLQDEPGVSWGDRLFVRDYNVTTDELYLVWKKYQDIHNEDCPEGHLERIVFDPPSWKEIAWELINATKGMNALAEQFIEEHGYDIEDC